jgi:hypothetical protein
MTVELLVAIIAGVVALASAAITVLGQSRNANRQHGWTKTARLENLLARYGDPLANAAYDLQSRLWNIGRSDFMSAFFLHGDDQERDYAEKSTLWLAAQYFGWVEIIRRETQFLDLGDLERNRTLGGLLWAVRGAFATDAVTTTQLRFFRGEQRAVGEVMIVARAAAATETRADPMGYAQFRKNLEQGIFNPWGSRWSAGIEEFASSASADPRVRLIQNALVDLVSFLDPHALRYPRSRLQKLGED